MNPKTKKKIIIDAVMSILFLLLMNTAWTGLLLHEWIGIGIIALFAAHLVINRQWIASVTKSLTTLGNWRVIGQYILNFLLTLAMGLTLVSGVLISQYVLPFLAMPNINLWLTLHSVASWLTLGIIIAHTALHWRWIQSVIRRLNPAAKPVLTREAAKARLADIRAWRPAQTAARLLVSIFALVAAYSLITGSVIDLILPVSASEKITGSADTGNTAAAGQPTTQSTVIVQSDAGKQTTVTLPATTATTAAKVTLQEYLSKLYCTACPKHCLLTRPQCARGVQQAKTATAEYNASQEE